MEIGEFDLHFKHDYQDFNADGGALQAQSTLFMSITGSSFENNMAYGNGGAVRITKPPVNNAVFPLSLRILGSNFSRNNALNGGALFANKSLRWVQGSL